MMDLRRRLPKRGREMRPISGEHERIPVMATRRSTAQRQSVGCLSSLTNQTHSSSSTESAQISRGKSSSGRSLRVDSTSQLAGVLKVIIVAAALVGLSGVYLVSAQHAREPDPTSTSPSPATSTNRQQQQQHVIKVENSTASQSSFLAPAPSTSAHTVAPPPSSTAANEGALSTTERDLATSASSTSNSFAATSSDNNKQLLKKSSGAAPANNRWTHFGARLRPLAPVTQLGPGEHHEQAASDAKSSASLALGQHHFRAAQQQVGVAAAPPANSLEAAAHSGEASAGEEEEDDDEQDSEALLYKMMQQQNFLMNPGWQEPAGANRGPAPLDGPLASGANRNSAPLGRQAQAELANSKKVIKLLKSYSHIHQVDDSDDQIRGTYTRVAARRPEPRQQHQERRNGNQPIGGQHRAQHIYVSSRPVATSQSQLEARAQAHRQLPAESGNDYESGSPVSDDSQEAAGGSGASSSGPPPPEEDEFECPNNGIFADVASGCQSYHVCQSGAQVQEKFQCPLGTLFNDIILTCDFAHNVQCGSGATAAAHRKQPQSSNAIGQQQHRPQHHRKAQPSLVARPSVPQRPRQQQASAQSRISAQGPRQLVIGAQGAQSPYNQHNLPQTGSQAQAISTYQPVGPLSNSAGSQADERDEDDEPAEPLAPARLPPRVAPQATNARLSPPNLPYQAPPPPPTQNQQEQRRQQQQPRSMLANIQQQIQPQSAHLSQYPQQAQRTQQQPHRSPPSQHQLTQQDNFKRAPQQHLQQSQAAHFQPANVFYGDSATSASPVFAEPQQQATERPAVIEHKQADHNNGAQSFNLIIDHVAPTNSKLDEVQRLGHRTQAVQKESRVAPVARPQFGNTQEAPVYKSSVDQPQRRPQIAQAPPQRPFNNGPLPAALPAAPLQAHEQLRSTPVQQQQQPLQRPINFAQARHYEARREAPRQQQQQHAPRNQRQDAAHFGGTSEASQRAATVTHAPPLPLPARGVVDLTRDQQAGVAADAMNDGLVLIVRHSSGSAPLQVGGAFRASARVSAGAHQQKPASDATGQAFAVEPSLVRADSPLDAQLFPNVQQLLASSGVNGGGSATQASNVLVSHQLPEQAGLGHHGRASFGPVRGELAPMEPPRPFVEHQAGRPQESADQSSLDQLASSASSAAGSSATAAATTTSASASTTTAASVSKDKLKTQKQQAAKAITTPQKPATNQQEATRRKRAKRLKAAQSPAKPQSSGPVDASTAGSTSTSSAISSTTPSSPTRANKRDGAQQQASSTPASSPTRRPAAN